MARIDRKAILLMRKYTGYKGRYDLAVTGKMRCVWKSKEVFKYLPINNYNFQFLFSQSSCWRNSILAGSRKKMFTGRMPRGVDNLGLGGGLAPLQAANLSPPKHHWLTPPNFSNMNINVSLYELQKRIPQSFKCHRTFSFRGRGKGPPNPPSRALSLDPAGGSASWPLYRLALLCLPWPDHIRWMKQIRGDWWPR